MLVPINTPEGLTERSQIRSGAMTRSSVALPGEDPNLRKDYGVVFTSSVNPSPDDFDTAILERAIIENTDLPDDDDQRLFTVVGGYYLERSGVGNDAVINTSHVFGVALQPELGFAITEGGSTVLAEHWEQKGVVNPSRQMDERLLGPAEGWTLIVAEVRSRGKYPLSGRPMGVLVSCPDAVSLQSTVVEETPVELVVEFNAVVEGGEAGSFTWDFGDGSPAQTGNEPVIRHAYAKAAGTPTEPTASVTIDAGGPCNQEADVTFSVPGACPSPTAIAHQMLEHDDDSQVKVRFTALFDGPAPARFSWQFGDGGVEENVTAPTIDHIYEKPDGDAESVTVRVILRGPGDCEAEFKKEISIPGECPVINEITWEKSEADPSAEIELVVFTVLFDGPKPDSFTWNFGDGSDEETTSEPVASHEYVRPAGQEVQHTVRVTLSGPESCSVSGTVDVPIAGTCPILQSIDVSCEQPTDISQRCAFTVSFQPPEPDEWLWEIEKDGEATEIPDSSDKTEVSHTFERPSGEADTYVVRVTAAGPDACRSSIETSVVVAGRCPIITNVAVELDESTDSDQVVRLKAVVEGGEPEEYTWDFGDGSPEIRTTDPETIHTYERPVGDAVLMAIRVTANGPDDCASSASTEIQIPGICPALKNIVAICEEPTIDLQTCMFTAEVDGPEPTTWQWTVNKDGVELDVDGATDESSLTHTFSRGAGIDETYTVSLAIAGPGACVDSWEIQITVPGVCPDIGSIDIQEIELTEQTLTVRLTAAVTGPAPESFLWSFGDDSEETTTTPSIEHTYERPEGSSKSFAVLVTAAGPASCSTTGNIEVLVPGSCGKISSVTAEEVSLTETEQVYRFSAIVTEPPMESYRWDFGDNSGPVTTSDPFIEHTFERPARQAGDFTVEVRGSGPGECISENRVSIRVPGACPVIKDLVLECDEPENGMITCFCTVATSGQRPVQYVWEFSNGIESRTTSVPTLIHRIPLAVGDPETLTIKVTVVGPEDCESSAEGEITIPGMCPAILEIQKTAGSVAEDGQLYTFIANIEGPLPDRLEWDFGDGTSTQTPPDVNIEHTYARPAGDADTFVLSVTAIGPDSCTDSSQTTVEIPGRCPVIGTIDATLGAQSSTEQHVSFTVEVLGPAPDSYRWNFGDGSEEVTTSESVVEHGYARPPGDTETIVASVTLIGPENCSTSANVSVEIQGQCPSCGEIETTCSDPEETQQTCQFTVQIVGPEPDEFIWDFGDGTPSMTTTTASISHSFARPAGNPETHTVTLVVKGPEHCETSAETTVSIPGICPTCGAIEATCAEPTDTEQTCTFSVAIEGPPPDSFEWNFGDGSEPVITEDPAAEHTFTRPTGDTDAFIVSVVANGPDHCSASAETTIEIPGICPTLGTIVVSCQDPAETEQTCRFTVAVEGPSPDSFEWNFGDGSVFQISTTPSIEHTYTRPEGDPATFTVTVRASGPERCDASTETTIEVPGICGTLTRLETHYDAPTHESITAHFEAVSTGPAATQFIWDFGDGSDPVTTTEHKASHTYERPLGDPDTLMVTVEASGPDSCSSESSTSVTIPGRCPRITAIKATEIETTETAYEVSVELTIVDGAADEYVWNWRDGSEQETTTQPTATHTYQRPTGDADAYTVHVDVNGPESCVCSASTLIVVPGVCPSIESIRVEDLALEVDTLEVKVVLDTGSLKADNYQWDWGDGSQPETTTESEHTHTYQRLIGEAKKYTVTVVGQGPENCGCISSASVEVPMVCPAIEDLAVHTLTIDEESQTIQVDVAVSEGAPERLIWDWGDGSVQHVSEGLSASHVYDRPYGDNLEYVVKVQALGPGRCSEEKELSVTIEGVCPEIEDFQLQLENPLEGKQRVNVDLVVVGPTPEEFVWNWGDGTPDQTTLAPASTHLYEQAVGESTTYEISVLAVGPGSCEYGNETEVTIAGICPEVSDIQVEKATLEAETQKVTFTVITGDPAPERYVWNWGDHTSETTTSEAVISHVYERPIGDSRCFHAQVTLEGPGDCSTSYQADVLVRGICPEIMNVEVEATGNTGAAYEVRLTLTVSGPPATEYVWDWGDGTEPESTSLPVAEHTYTSPQGPEQSFNVKAHASGPGGCSCPVFVQIDVPGACPELGDIMVHPEDPGAAEQVVRFELPVGDLKAEHYIWSWGDGSEPEQTALPVGSHTYYRETSDATFDVYVIAVGPGECSGESATCVSIPGTCPSIDKIDVSYGTLNANNQVVRLRAIVRGEPRPDKYEWDFGDGQRRTTDVPFVEYAFERPVGLAKKYNVSVKSSGPECGPYEQCSDTCFALIKVAGDCGVITDGHAIYGEGNELEAPVTVLISLKGEKPRGYRWDWGDGTLEDTHTPHHTHTYRRSATSSKRYLVKVQTIGRNDGKAKNHCTVEETVEVVIDSWAQHNPKMDS